MKLFARIVTVLVVAGAGAAVPSAALASHPHVLHTPGGCVDRGGQGFGTGEPHDHRSFHSRVHKGTPGMFAFEQPGNPVSVAGGSTCNGH